MKQLLFLLFIVFIVQCCFADAGWDLVSSSSGGATIGIQENTNQYSTNLQRFNQTNGYYRDIASRTAFLSIGTSGHTFSNVNNGNINGTLEFQAASAGLVSEGVYMHEDNTNVPNTLCDTNTGLAQQSGDLINATNNTSFTIPGVVAKSEDAGTTVTFMGQGSMDDIMYYNSEKNLEDTNISLDYEAGAPVGNLFRISHSYVEAGNNRTNEIAQYSQYDRGHLLKSSNDDGMEVREKLTYTGYSYDGPNMPIEWKTTNPGNVSNVSANLSVNLSPVNLTI